LRLRIEKALKGRAGADSYFVFLPVGEFSVGATRLCVADPDYPHPPGVGDQVFVFTREPEGDSLNILMVESPADLLRVGPDGVVDLPPTYESLKREGKLTKTGLVRKIEAHGSKGK